MTFGLFGSQYVPSPAHELRIGVWLPAERRPDTSVDSAPNAPAVDVTNTSGLRFVHLLTTFCTFVLPRDWYVSSSWIFPPSCVNRALNAWMTFLKYTITVSVARPAVFQPLLQAYCAIAEPSSCATFP